MTMSNDRKELYARKLTLAEQNAVDAAMDAALASFKATNTPIIGDDRVENAVGALARLVYESRDAPKEKQV